MAGAGLAAAGSPRTAAAAGRRAVLSPHAAPARTARLEEIESATVGGEDAWLVTLSMINSADALNILAATLGTKGSREYKTFTVTKRDGQVKSMKIRELADA